ncbi:Plasma membrane proteolipid [Dirofilaria immitis]
MCLSLILVILCFIFPPLAVLIARGCDVHLLLNIIFTLLAWLPGVIHAIYRHFCDIKFGSNKYKVVKFMRSNTFDSPIFLIYMIFHINVIEQRSDGYCNILIFDEKELCTK